MAIIRVEKTQNYTVMSNHHLRNKDLTLKAKGLMSLMLSLPPAWDYSIAGLSAICKEGATSIRSALKELEENKYLIRERKNSEKGYFIYEYTLYEIPDLAYIENMHTVNTHADKGRTEERTQINKDSLNKEKLNKEELNTDLKGEEENYLSKFNDILKHLKDIELKNLYIDFIEMRKNSGSPISPRGLSMVINRAARITNFDKKLEKEILEAAIINCWKNVYLLNDKKNDDELFSNVKYQKDDLYYKMKEFYEGDE